jgi:NAD(P)-dependent dehydrogenase (short-subunit alcohol dehydrogenase family)
VSALSGLRALVTGGARGIGAAIAVELARQGALVQVWDRQDVASYPDGLGSRIALRSLDLTDEAQVNAGAAQLLEDWGGLDILVNNAGIQGATTPIAGQDNQTWDRVIGLNLTSTFWTCRLFAPVMALAGRGRIVNVASVAGINGVAHGVAYSASKGDVIALTRALAKELVASGVTVNCVAPGMVQTDLLKQMDPGYIAGIVAKMPMKRLGQATEVAAAVAWLASPNASFTTGAALDVSGGRLIA